MVLDMVLDMALAIGDTAMVLVVLATVMARGRLMPSLTMFAKGLPTLRLMPTTDMGGMALAMEAMAMVVLAMVMARGLLTLRLTHTTAMEDMAWAMEAMAMVVLAMVMARGRLMPSLTMADTVGPTLVLDTAMAAMVALSVDTATWDKECQRL